MGTSDVLKVSSQNCTPEPLGECYFRTFKTSRVTINHEMHEQFIRVFSTVRKSKIVFYDIRGFLAGYGIVCYKCITRNGWDDCANKTVTCPSAADRCFKAHLQVTVNGSSTAVYGKSCVPSFQCDPDSFPPCMPDDNDTSTTLTKCNLHCCAGDLCNYDTSVTDGAWSAPSCNWYE